MRLGEMTKLEQLRPNAAVRGILPDSLVTVVNVQWFGSEALELTYKTSTGKLASGAPDQVVRTVTENSRTLKFTSQGFERE
jgi:hypothetical protein